MTSRRDYHRLSTVIASIVSALYTLLLIYKFLYSEWDWISTSMLVVGLIFIWLFSLYLASKKHTIGEKFGTPTVKLAYPSWIRRCAWVCIFALPVGSLAWVYYKSLHSGRFIIAVANFDGPDPQYYRVTELLSAHLRQVTKDYSDIDVLPLNRSITEQEGPSKAIEIGQNAKATVVIWGWMGKRDRAFY
mgnify:CR=1 FL=1